MYTPADSVELIPAGLGLVITHKHNTAGVGVTMVQCDNVFVRVNKDELDSIIIAIYVVLCKGGAGMYAAKDFSAFISVKGLYIKIQCGRIKDL